MSQSSQSSASTESATSARPALVPVGSAPATKPPPPSVVPAAATPPKPAAAPPPSPAQPAVVHRARFRRRHIALALSFVACVLLPVAVSAWYLWTRAADQYASTVGFSVRKEEGGSPMELLGGLTQISGTSSSDTDILYEFLQSQRLVAQLQGELDLRAIWSRPEGDPVFTFRGGSIEDLLAYWKRMVRISYDGASGMIEVRVLAFTAEDAQKIATALFEDSSAMINELSAIAREDSIRYARQDLDDSVERLKAARAKITEFRNRTQIVDPTIDLANQGGLLGTLQAQLAGALIEVDLLKGSVRENDPRMAQALRRVEVIEARIGAERGKLGLEDRGPADGGFSELVSEYEALAVDLEFAQRTYVAAMASYDAALAESRRKSRYLAAYSQPTLAETSRFPERGMLISMLGLFLFLAWATLALVAYALRDRR